jgi:3-hydroxyisobutyrate dehydrogenase-like beta-hydroxyacid dehydrogenase
MDVMKVGIVGGMGLMASPMARHLRGKDEIKVVAVHDRGDPRRERARLNWKEYGTELVPEIKDVVRGRDLDGVFVCCGKNGDDLSIILDLVQELSETKNRFLCHLSTVSPRFAREAQKFAASKGVHYVNYPLTGGPLGAEKAVMLILCAGAEDFFLKMEPVLKLIGKPKYFGERVDAASDVKLIGHLMVFNGLVGITSAAALHSECFMKGEIGGGAQTEFFDFLNQGAGGTKQWDLILRQGIADDLWEQGFFIKHAVVDAIYLAELLIERKIAFPSFLAVINLILSFSYVLNNYGDSFGTHRIVKELIANKSDDLDKFIFKNMISINNRSELLNQAINSLPKKLIETVLLGVKF